MIDKNLGVHMKPSAKTSRIFGLAFLLQFLTSFFSGSVLNQTWLVAGNIEETTSRIAKNAWLFRANILVDMLTAFGIVFLGAVLYAILRKKNEEMALVGFGLYLIEAALLAGSKLPAFSLLQISQGYAGSGQPAIFQVMANLALESMNFMGSTLHMLAFCPGAIIFYTLLYQSRIVPRGLSLWGLIAVIPCLAATLFALFGSPLPFYVYLPYVPFELVIAIWIILKGVEPREKLLVKKDLEVIESI